MAVEVIPSGSSVVVTQEEKGWAKDAERVKDTLSTMASTSALQFANVERSVANHFENTIQDVKDAESRLGNSIANHFENTIQDIKDAEVRLTKDAGDKFIQTIQDIKDANKDTLLSSAHTNELLQRTELEVAKESARTRDEYWQGVREQEKTAYQNQMNTMLAFKEQALLSEKLAAQQALLSEKLYAQAAREAAECCCEIKREVAGVKDAFKQAEIDRLREALSDAKLLGHRYRTFVPVPSGTLQAEEG